MRELAALAGVAKSTVYVAESWRHVPRIQSLEKLARVLGVSVAELLEK
jgi:transcriptional regulator with XRE-family HTH domain